MTILESYAEQIVKIINQERKRRLLEKNDITKGYAEIFYDTVTFERKKLCNEQFSMILPIFFDVMKEEYIALKYCAENRPEFIYTNKELNINITFSFLCKKEKRNRKRNKTNQYRYCINRKRYFTNRRRNRYSTFSVSIRYKRYYIVTRIFYIFCK